MAGSITDFTSSFNVDVARPSRFDVNIPIPLALASYISTSRQLSFRCENAELPGRTFMTAERRFGSAPAEKMPYHTTYNETNMTFIVSDDMSEKLFFDGWMELINPTTNFNFQYKNLYAVDISVNQYDVSNELTYVSVLLDAFPTSVNQLDMDWSTDGHHKLVVTFAYTSWYNNTVKSLGQSVVNSALSGLMNTFS
jgi:hypothetical protein